MNDDDTALSWSAMYGTVPTTRTTAASAPRPVLLPYREATKSAIEIRRSVFAMRTILR